MKRILPLVLAILTGLPGISAAKTTAPAPETWQPGHPVNPSELPKNALQGKAPTNFKKGTVYLIDFWQCPKPGPRAYMFHRRRPGYHGQRVLDELTRTGKNPGGVELLTIAVQETSPPERIKKFLSLPALKCGHPVLNDGEKGTIYTTWLPRCGFKSFPHTLVVKDGTMLWSGEGSLIPADLIEQAASPDFNLTTYLETRQRESELFKTLRPAMDKIHAAYQAGASAGKLNAMLDTEEKRIGHLPFCYMTIQETRFNIARKHKNKQQAIAAMQRAADQFPNDTFIQGRVFKYLSSCEELKPDSYPLMIQCLKRQATLKDNEYASHCWLAIGNIHKRTHHPEKATKAYQKAVSLSNVQKRLNTLKAKAPLPLAE